MKIKIRYILFICLSILLVGCKENKAILPDGLVNYSFKEKNYDNYRIEKVKSYESEIDNKLRSEEKDLYVIWKKDDKYRENRKRLRKLSGDDGKWADLGQTDYYLTRDLVAYYNKNENNLSVIGSFTEDEFRETLEELDTDFEKRAKDELEFMVQIGEIEKVGVEEVNGFESFHYRVRSRDFDDNFKNNITSLETIDLWLGMEDSMLVKKKIIVRGRNEKRIETEEVTAVNFKDRIDDEIFNDPRNSETEIVNLQDEYEETENKERIDFQDLADGTIYIDENSDFILRDVRYKEMNGDKASFYYFQSYTNDRNSKRVNIISNHRNSEFVRNSNIEDYFNEDIKNDNIEKLTINDLDFVILGVMEDGEIETIYNIYTSNQDTYSILSFLFMDNEEVLEILNSIRIKGDK